MKVAILEDCPVQAARIMALMNAHGHAAQLRGDSDAFITLMQQEKVDVALLDWEVPGISGLEVLKWIRNTLPPALPVLMVTQRDDEEDIVQALELGADDYLAKPVRERELLARMGAHQRRQLRDEPEEGCFQVGQFVFHPEARTVETAGRTISLPAREFQLASLLFRNIGRILTKDYLAQQIWGSADRRYDASLATYTSKIRAALGLRPRNGLVISTVYNYGYRLERTGC